MLDLLSDPNAWASLLTLTLLEVVLGIDNVIFLSIVSSRLPHAQARRARRIGLALALLMRIALLLSITWIIGLTAPIFEAFGQAVSWRDLVLAGGGLFLLVKGTLEIHKSVEGNDEGAAGAGAGAPMAMVIAQIAVLDLIFSLDSVITAVGLADHVEIMIVAVAIAIVVMAVAAEPVSGFVERHPTVKMLALGFLLLIGVALVADGLHFHIPRGYIYFAIAFSLLIEALNLLARRRQTKREKVAPSGRFPEDPAV